MLYTRKGDSGTTKTLKQPKGVRISKSSCQTEALGALDELNSFLGLCKIKTGNLRFRFSGEKFGETIHKIQLNLFIVQAEVAGAEKTINREKVGAIESLIDKAEKAMPPITTFFISGGTEQAAFLDVARTLARRAEREVIRAIESKETAVSVSTAAYLNRLSSLLYAMARFVNFKSGVKEKAPDYK